MAAMMGSKSFWEAWGDLAYAVRTGKTAFTHVHGLGVWEHGARNPEEAEVFDRAMAARTEQIADAALGAYDFGRFAHVVDVGSATAPRWPRSWPPTPDVRGTLLDQPQPAARAQASLNALGLASRCRVAAGDFFVRVPEGGDAYVLKAILHDWNDTASVGILRCCRRAMRPGAKLRAGNDGFDEQGGLAEIAARLSKNPQRLREAYDGQRRRLRQPGGEPVEADRDAGTGVPEDDRDAGFGAQHRDQGKSEERRCAQTVFRAPCRTLGSGPGAAPTRPTGR
jgi:hypothetical protein